MLCDVLLRGIASLGLIGVIMSFSALSLQYPACIAQMHHTTTENHPNELKI